MILKYLSKNFYINLMIIISIFLIDRISKIYVVNIDKTLIDSDLFNSTFLNISLVWNSGIAFGLLSISQSNLYNFITALIFVIILFLLILLSKAKNLQKYSYLIIIGGGLGNLFDRIFYKAVPDFIDIHYNGFHWFIFNIADIFITLGVLFLIFIEVFSNNKKEL